MDIREEPSDPKTVVLRQRVPLLLGGLWMGKGNDYGRDRLEQGVVHVYLRFRSSFNVIPFDFVLESST